MKRRITRLIVSLIVVSLGGFAGIKTLIAQNVHKVSQTVQSATVSEDVDREWHTAVSQLRGDVEQRVDSLLSAPSVSDTEENVEYSLSDDFVTYEYINDNIPYFTSDDLTTEAFETYSELDDLGRCGVAYANICEDLMPTENREEELTVRPSGYQVAVYDGIDNGGYLYNRCHLIGYFLAGENDNELNLITGTRYFNVEGMLPFEMEVGEYVWETGNHVLYRVTPVYEGNNLVASGVEMEAYSVEDNGEGVCYNVFVYNVQPGIEIDYATGNSWEE
jgi:DNA-entry nuclease